MNVKILKWFAVVCGAQGCGGRRSITCRRFQRANNVLTTSQRSLTNECETRSLARQKSSEEYQKRLMIINSQIPFL